VSIKTTPLSRISSTPVSPARSSAAATTADHVVDCGSFTEQDHRRSRGISRSVPDCPIQPPTDATTRLSEPTSMPALPPGLGVRCHDRLGGLIHEQAQVTHMDDLFGTHTVSPYRRTPENPSTILVRLDDARRLTNVVAFIRPAGQPPLDTASPRGRRASPQAPRPPLAHNQALHATVGLNPRCATSSSGLPDNKQPPEDCKSYVVVLGLTTSHARVSSSAGYRLGARYPTPPRLRPPPSPTCVGELTHQRIKRRPVLYGLIGVSPASTATS